MISLNQIKIASPCGESWEAMEGDERQRFCKGCSKTVYNLSGMTEEEGLALIAKNNSHLCVRFRRRADGTIMTADCPVGQTRVRKRRTVSFAWAVSLIAASLYVRAHDTAAAELVQNKVWAIQETLHPHHMMGSIAGSVAKSQ